MKKTILIYRFVLLIPFLASSYDAASQSNFKKDIVDNEPPAKSIAEKGVPLAINAMPIATNIYFNQGKITSTGRIVAKADVTFKSTYAIELKPGFQAEAGSNFKAIIAAETINISPVISNLNQKNLEKIKENCFTYRLFPNPVSENFNLEIATSTDGIAEIIVFNTLGDIQITKKMRINKGIEQFSINCNNWATGLYLVCIKINDSVTTERMIVTSH